MSFAKLADIQELCERENVPFFEAVILGEMEEENLPREAIFRHMTAMYHAMKEADEKYEAGARSVSGMAGGDGAKLEAYRLAGGGLAGPFLTEVMEKAVKMAESNACMKRIVAAPTAGSCGVLPAVLLTYKKHFHPTEKKMTEALFVAAGIGEVLATSASIAGAEGGCQAEIGSAAAMAAGALTYLVGGDTEALVHAAALSIKNMLGLTCDPVAGLVEVPCIKRNAYGAMNAVLGCELARAGIRSRVTPDEVIDAMARTGRLIPSCLRETGKEGLATTKTAQEVMKKLNA